MIIIRRQIKLLLILSINVVLIIVVVNSFWLGKPKTSSSNYLPIKIKSSCGIRPKPTNLTFENDFWQVFETSNGTFKLLNAYYDSRDFFVAQSQTLIRFFAMVNRVDPVVRTHCQLWFDGHVDPIVSEIVSYTYTFPRSWGINNKGWEPYLISCSNPFASSGRVPTSVSMVENECDVPKNNFDLIQNWAKSGIKKVVGICSKLYFFKKDKSMMLIEWIEIQFLLGVDKINFHVIEIHPNMMKVLKFYEKTTKKVKVELLTLPQGVQHTTDNQMQKDQNEMIALTDCFYKNMNEFFFLLSLDINEIVVPSKPEDKTFDDLLSRVIEQARKSPVQPELYSCYAVRGSYFLLSNDHKDEIQPQVPHNFLFLQHVYRGKYIAEPYNGPKSFQKTDEVEVMHKNLPFKCLNQEPCNIYEFKAKDAKAHYYKSHCPYYEEHHCDDLNSNTTKDDTLWKYKTEIVANVRKIVKKLKSFKID